MVKGMQWAGVVNNLLDLLENDYTKVSICASNKYYYYYYCNKRLVIVWSCAKRLDRA